MKKKLSKKNEKKVLTRGRKGGNIIELSLRRRRETTSKKGLKTFEKLEKKLKKLLTMSWQYAKMLNVRHLVEQ